MGKNFISLVIPVFNEEEAIPLFVETVAKTFDKADFEYELIFVNDGSADNTKNVLRELCENNSYIHALNFSRNFGQQPAILCGLKEATGDAVVPLDVDLQDPPEVILEMIDKWQQGYDIVHGKRLKRKGESLFKRVSAKLYYKFLNSISLAPVPRDIGDFKLYSRKALDIMLTLDEHNRLLRAQAGWIGLKQTYVEFARPERQVGETKYTLKKMVKLASDGIVSNSYYPLKLAVSLSLFCGTLSLLCLLTFIVLVICGISLPLAAWLFPFGGIGITVILFCNGMTNIYLQRVYEEVKNRPHYIVEDRFN